MEGSTRKHAYVQQQVCWESSKLLSVTEVLLRMSPKRNGVQCVNNLGGKELECKR